ncbi:unnamed protein product [Prorocentrum cordatum]|uniref:Uncharacterized protein n=1 Tax=Prorocentrum cordatum TaxID=2364126 RepID=A0ABN9RTJ1_9DINO|nr:unnamed protein product [Polarella glacialis]
MHRCGCAPLPQCGAYLCWGELGRTVVPACRSRAVTRLTAGSSLETSTADRTHDKGISSASRGESQRFSPRGGGGMRGGKCAACAYLGDTRAAPALMPRGTAEGVSDLGARNGGSGECQVGDQEYSTGSLGQRLAGHGSGKCHGEISSPAADVEEEDDTSAATTRREHDGQRQTTHRASKAAPILFGGRWKGLSFLKAWRGCRMIPTVPAKQLV